MSGFPLEIVLWIAFIVCVFGFLATVWQYANARGAKSRGRRRTQEAGRSTDKRKLTRNEKRLYLQSQQLLSQGNVLAASRILEQVQMRREAIQALEDAGLIHEAAKILMRMRRANRAGVVYARHAMWVDAAKCFVTADMPLEVAKCAREAGDFKTAGEYFEKANRPDAAAACFAKLGELHTAAKLYSASGQKEKAMNMYVTLTETTQNIASLDFNNNEVQLIMDYMVEGNRSKGLVDLVINKNKLTEVLINLVTKNMIKQAAELYLRSNNDIGPQLMAEIDYQSDAAKNLAEVFLNVSQFNYAGMVLERLSEYERAGEAFKQAEDFNRAAHCFERCGKEDLANQLRDTNKNAAQPAHDAPPPFTLKQSKKSAFGDSNDESNQFETEDSTQVFEHETPPVPQANAKKQTKTKISEPKEPANKSSPVGQFSLKATVPSVPSSHNETDESTFKDHVATKKSDEPVKPSNLEMKLKRPTPPLPEISNSSSNEPVSLDDGRSAFHKAKFFSDLDFDQKNKLWNIGRSLNFASEEELLTYNDEPKGVYVIIEGSVSVYRMSNQLETYVDQMSESDTFGELWLLSDQPSEVKFIASKNTRIRIIERDNFNELLDKDGALARKIYRRFTNRLIKRLLKPVKKPFAETKKVS